MPISDARDARLGVRPLRILVVADPDLPVPPRLYGGIERVIALLIDGLRARGHQVALVAHADSTVDCDRIAYPAPAKRALVDRWRHAAMVARATREWAPDVVQSFARLATLGRILALDVPKVMSYQRAITAGAVRRARLLARDTLTFTGCSRRQIAPVEHCGTWQVIYNAVPTGTYRFQEHVAADAPFVFLGRIERIKGVHEAIDIARRANRRLVIAGNVPDHTEAREYFASAVAPNVDNDRVRYVGPVDDRAKSELLSTAAALLMPVLWDEPFGIVMAESLACGTPVLGYARGAVPEVVEDGETGFVREDAAGLAAMVPHLGAISRMACRQAAERRFSQRALVDAYEALYRTRVASRDVGVSVRRVAHV